MKAKKDNRLLPVHDNVNMNEDPSTFLANSLAKSMYVGQESRTGTHDADPVDDGIARPLTQFQNIPGPPLV